MKTKTGIVLLVLLCMIAATGGAAVVTNQVRTLASLAAQTLDAVTDALAGITSGDSSDGGTTPTTVNCADVTQC